jgi:DNA-directed RNA polymerase specialized sigma24 family protein
MAQMHTDLERAHRVARGMLLGACSATEHDAQDGAQETCFRLLRWKPTARDGREGSYIASVARSVHLDRVRVLARERPPDHPTILTREPAPQLGDYDEPDPRLGSVRKVLARMSPVDRALCLAYYNGGRAERERLCTKHKIPPHLLKIRAFRARARARRELERFGFQF